MGKSKGGNAKANKITEKKVKKVVEDKTFGLKNKNKSKKVQKYIDQVTNSAKHGGGKNQSRAYHEKQAAAKKAEKEARKQAELEMFKLLGDAYKPKKKNKSKKLKKKEAEEKKQKAEEEKLKKKEIFERDFAIPIVPLKDVFQIDSKAEIERICAVITHKDNLPSKDSAGQPCLHIEISDGTTLKPFTLVLIGETPTSFNLKEGTVIDVRNSIAMVRGEKVLIETVKEMTTVSGSSPELTEHVIKLKEEQETLRAQGGIPIEQLIEEKRAKLESEKLTPVTKESFYAWKEKKRKKRDAEAEEKRKAVEKKVERVLRIQMCQLVGSFLWWTNLCLKTMMMLGMIPMIPLNKT